MAKKGILFKQLASMFEELENTSSSLEMRHILAAFFKDVSPQEARMAAYLMRGKVDPGYVGPEFGIAWKLVTRALAESAGRPAKEVEHLFHKKGDLGTVAEDLAGNRRGTGLTFKEVFKELRGIAYAAGEGSQDKKVQTLAHLLSRGSPREAKYTTRIVLGQLRLGVAEMTFLYGLSEALGEGKEGKEILEAAYNVLSDLGEVASQAVEHGVEKLKNAKPVTGVPVRMMLAQRVKGLGEIHEHISGAVELEYKYDGERVQAHILGKGKIALYSRRHEDITQQFPDVGKALLDSFLGKEAIVEGEVVAIDEGTGKLKDFQTLMQRRRKYEVEAYIKKIPVKCFLFDVLSLDGASLLSKPLEKRKELLASSFQKSGGVAFTASLRTKNLEEMEGFFAEAVDWGAEGVMVKALESFYEAGSRGWNWIKFKKDYQEELGDSFDLVAVGGLYGRGRRAGSYGSLLLAAFDPEGNRYPTFTKVGAGFTDEDLGRIPSMLNPLRLKEKHRLVETDMEADVWFSPQLVLEVRGSDITVSPVHATAKDKTKKGGLALRFPRFLKWREDKKPEQATTVGEIYELYQRMKKS